MLFHTLKNTLSLILIVMSFDVKSTDNLLLRLDQLRQENQISAAVVIIVDKEKIITQTHLGKSSWESEAPLNQTDMFRVGSISKSFAAILALKMQQSSLIDLTNPLKHYLKKEYIKNEFDTEITIQQLLEHTAGLHDLSKAEWDYNKSQRKSIEQALALNLGSHISKWQPGLHPSYSNVGVAYLALVLEKTSGKSYEQLMNEYVFMPLGMSSSTLFLEKHVGERLIKGYNSDGKSLIPYWHNIYRPFAAINTDASDMVNFLKMLLNYGKFNNQTFLSPAEISRIESPKSTLAAKSGLHYGYGLGNYSWQTNGYTFHGHGGDADGYLSRYGYNRESGLAYFVMINAFKHKPLKKMRDLIEFHIIKELPKPVYPTRLKLSDADLGKYIGSYQKVTFRFKPVSKLNSTAFKIINKDKSLFIQYKNQAPIPIYAVTNTQFRYPDDSVATMAFILHDGKMYFQSDKGNYMKLK